MAHRLLVPARMRVLICLGLVACTSSSGGGVTGDPPGGSFEPVDAIATTVTISDGAGGTSSSAWIAIATTANLCSDVSASPVIDRKNQRFITIQLSDVTGSMSTAPTAPGTYTIYPNTGSQPPKMALLTTGGFDGTCQMVDTDSASGQSGSVTLTAVSAGTFTGTFDVTLNTGDHITGSFTPEACPQLATAVAGTDSHSCM
jgi:hypothetical protein